MYGVMPVATSQDLPIPGRSTWSRYGATNQHGPKGRLSAVWHAAADAGLSRLVLTEGEPAEGLRVQGATARTGGTRSASDDVISTGSVVGHLDLLRRHGAICLPLRCRRRGSVLVKSSEFDVQVRREPVARAQLLQQLLRRRTAQATVLHLDQGWITGGSVTYRNGDCVKGRDVCRIRSTFDVTPWGRFVYGQGQGGSILRALLRSNIAMSKLLALEGEGSECDTGWEPAPHICILGAETMLARSAAGLMD